jgi:hypothetical protein
LSCFPFFLFFFFFSFFFFFFFFFFFLLFFFFSFFFLLLYIHFCRSSLATFPPSGLLHVPATSFLLRAPYDFCTSSFVVLRPFFFLSRSFKKKNGWVL